MNASLACASLLLAALSATPDVNATRRRFEQLDDARDQAGLVALWREVPAEALFVIDGYLEGSLRMREGDTPPDEQVVAALHGRALRGAQSADQALGGVLLGDYASAFVGWTAEEQRRFRNGQKAYQQARAAVQVGKFAEAAQLAEESLDLAEPLGDWWGSAMALSALGDAHEGLGNAERALAYHARARVVHAALGHYGAELRNVLSMARLSLALDRRPRAAACIASGLARLDELDDPTMRLELLTLRRRLERADGRHADSERTAAEILALEKELKQG